MVAGNFTHHYIDASDWNPNWREVDMRDVDYGTLLTQVDEVTLKYRAQSETDFLLFIQGLVIPSATGPQLFRSCVQPFQMEFFEDAEPALNALRRGDIPAARRFWVERTKKASKDGDIALCIMWLVAFTDHPFLGQVCASDQSQAGIIKHRILGVLHFNPWLNDLIMVQQNKILSKRLPQVVRTVIEATDASGGAHGETPDLLVLNELVHVAKWETMETHMNNADGVPSSVVIVATNAGYQGTKAEKWRKNALANSKRWHVHIWNKLSPWANPKDIEDATKRNTPSEVKRLWKGQWVSGKGDALDENDIDRCFREDLEPLTEPEPGWLYLGALDLGVSHDHAGVVLVGINVEEQRIRVAYTQGFKPDAKTSEGLMEVDLVAVENTCAILARTFRVIWFGYDPAAGGSFMAQRLGKRGVPVAKVSFSSPKNINDMAKAFMQLVKGGKLECYDDPEGRLRSDFGKFDIVAMRPGSEQYKLKAVSDESGHADVGTALVIALPKALEMIGGIIGWLADDVLTDMNDEPLTDEEMEELPEEFREIYGEGAKRNRLSLHDSDDDDDDWYQ